METSQKNPGAANLGQIPGYLLLGGGLPVKAGNEVIGAVGIGGAPAAIWTSNAPRRRSTRCRSCLQIR